MDIKKLGSEEARQLWLSQFPWPKPDGHKYTRGHVIVLGGPLQTSGAAKLSATSALRTSAGAVTILCPTEDDMRTYVASCRDYAPMFDTYKAVDRFFYGKDSKNVHCIIVGPGFGKGEVQSAILGAAVNSGKKVLMDADALDEPRVNPNAVLTPHEGEFERLFPGMEGTREEKAMKAAQATQSVVLLKGRETVIASPDGRLAVNPPATPWLGTAGSGDTLSGIIGGLMASGVPPFEAAIAGAAIHARAGELAGPGLIADDIVAQIPKILLELSPQQAKKTSGWGALRG